MLAAGGAVEGLGEAREVLGRGFAGSTNMLERRQMSAVGIQLDRAHPTETAIATDDSEDDGPARDSSGLGT